MGDDGAEMEAFLSTKPRADDARALAAMMAEASGEPAALWPGGIVGFGRYRYRYDSGREGEAPRIGFAPRKAALTLYLTGGEPMREELLARLGRHTAGKGCVYLKALGDVDAGALAELLAASLADNRARHPD